jgi:hypothetical protein
MLLDLDGLYEFCLNFPRCYLVGWLIEPTRLKDIFFVSVLTDLFCALLKYDQEFGKK